LRREHSTPRCWTRQSQCVPIGIGEHGERHLARDNLRLAVKHDATPFEHTARRDDVGIASSTSLRWLRYRAEN
jgi:hypothetical protein